MQATKVILYFIVVTLKKQKEMGKITFSNIF